MQLPAQPAPLATPLVMPGQLGLLARLVARSAAMPGRLVKPLAMPGQLERLASLMARQEAMPDEFEWLASLVATMVAMWRSQET